MSVHSGRCGDVTNDIYGDWRHRNETLSHSWAFVSLLHVFCVQIHTGIRILTLCGDNCRTLALCLCWALSHIKWDTNRNAHTYTHIYAVTVNTEKSSEHLLHYSVLVALDYTLYSCFNPCFGWFLFFDPCWWTPRIFGLITVLEVNVICLLCLWLVFPTHLWHCVHVI